ncbi:LytR C-terminal domain-containing protein [Candidatus Microgenomates bacterium]|nr:LytR C-terminal domain-containing protein [Candidatus Microgenomates bacterium]
METASQEYAPAKPTKRTFGKKQAIITIIVLLLITAAVIFMMSRQPAPTEESISPTPTELPTEAPTPEATTSASPSVAPTKSVTPSTKPSPTRSAEVKKSTDMNIQIQNGSGEVGIAGQVRDFLKGKGYQYFETANADNYDYKDVTVKVKSSLTTYGSSLMKDLGEKYKLASDSATLPNDSVFDAVVIVGK